MSLNKILEARQSIDRKVVRFPKPKNEAVVLVEELDNDEAEVVIQELDNEEEGVEMEEERVL